MTKKKSSVPITLEDSDDFEELAVVQLQRLVHSVKKVRTNQEQLAVGQAQLSTHVEATGERVTRMEDRINEGHACLHSERFSRIEGDVEKVEDKQETDIGKGIEQQARLTAVENSTGKQEARSRNSWILAITMVLGLVGSGTGAVYHEGQQQATIELDRATNRREHTTLTTSVNTSSKRQEQAQKNASKLVSKQLKVLADEISNSNGHEATFENQCEGMTKSRKARRRRVFLNEELRIPRSCWR